MTALISVSVSYTHLYVPPHQAVIHQYAREMLAGGGKMILGSDSHTRYGALGTMAMGEGGPELVKQLLNKTYDIKMPGVIAIYLDGEPMKGVGPQDVALAIIGATFGNEMSIRDRHRAEYPSGWRSVHRLCTHCLDGKASRSLA